MRVHCSFMEETLPGAPKRVLEQSPESDSDTNTECDFNDMGCESHSFAGFPPRKKSSLNQTKDIDISDSSLFSNNINLQDTNSPYTNHIPNLHDLIPHDPDTSMECARP